MLHLKYDSSNKGKSLAKQNLFIITFLIISNLSLIHCETEEIPKFVENIIIFDHTKLNTGSINKKGELFIEYYSEENFYDIPTSLLFHGLSKNGRYCLSNESSHMEEKNLDIDEIIDIVGYYNNYKIYDSKSLFVSIKNDFKSGNQYLFSINSNYSIVELHDFNNNTGKNHYIWDLSDFFNLNENKYGFPYETSLFQLKGNSLYIIAFIPKSPVNEDFYDLSFIKKFTFKSFNDDAYEELKSITFNDYINRLIIGTFFMDDLGILVTISYKLPDYERRRNLHGICLYDNYPKLYYTLNLFNENLEPSKPNSEIKMSLKDLRGLTTEYIYFKPIYLKSKHVMYAYITYCYLFFELFYININSEGSKVRPNGYGYMMQININANNFVSDFIKINERKLVYILFTYFSNNGNIDFNSELHIKIIEINKDYTDYTVTERRTFDLGDYIPKMQISGFIYNDFLIFTSTAILKEDIYELRKEINYFSMFMIFGYPNGTDSTINISDFIFNGDINDIQLDNINNFYDFLFKNYTIENNIFEYNKVDEIKLVSIPEEIIISETEVDETGKISLAYELKNNSIIYRDIIYVIKQKKNLIKTSKYYYIDYQYMVEKINDEEQKRYYGRTNRLKFKLCHDYCETCYELGTSNNNQKCVSCLLEYQYDYLYYSNRAGKNLENCVPEGYYYDGNNLTLCNLTEFFFYI